MTRIIADENIPYVHEAFSSLGDVHTMPGRTMTPEHVRDADMLLVRSITQVDRRLLEGSQVRFVATATIGEDHIDKAYLADRGIAFSSAPGCNANSVAQYITSALHALACSYDLDLPALTLGIVGVGNVGKRVHAHATALGMNCVLHDPPLARETRDPKYRPMEEVLDCDVLTFHVPLTRTGPDATYHMADAAYLQQLKPGAILLNSARGPVVDGAALGQALAAGPLKAAVLDVWEGEPSVDPDLLKHVFIGTPHIAGYSFDGKVNGACQIYEAACAHLGQPATWDPAPLLPAPPCPEVVVDGKAPWREALGQALLPVYDIRTDDAAMRTVLETPVSEWARRFDALRKEYPQRREYQNTRAVVTPADPAIQAMLAGLGYQADSEQ